MRPTANVGKAEDSGNKRMSDLNKAKISVDNSRKETVKKLSAPLKEFEGQIKKVTAIFDATYKSLSDQVQHFVSQERENKRTVVQNAISEELDKRKGEVQAFAIPIQDKWLLKSTTLKSIREAVQGIIDQRIESLRLQQQAEQARVERASAIEQAVKATNAEYHLELSVAQFMTQWHTSLSTPLDDVCKDITSAAQRALARQEERSVPAPAAKRWVAPQTSAAPAVTTAPAAEAGPDKTMATTTRIEWADATTNTAVGCSHCSPGCDHCYAEKFAHRLSKNPVAAKVYAGVVDGRGKWTGKINSNFSEKMYPHRVPGKGKRVFVGSMPDLEPCAECGRPAKTVAGTGSLISIGCFRTGCRCVPVTYWVGNNRSRSAAIRSWNFRWKKKHPDAAIENYEEVA